jgi:two-component system, LytTR family, sensor histidine kinase AlgZ
MLSLVSFDHSHERKHRRKLILCYIVTMTTPGYNDFIFSRRYRLLRHVLYWLLHIIFWTLLLNFMLRRNSVAQDFSLLHNLFNVACWLPVAIPYSYLLAYFIVPKLLLREKFVQFIFAALLWIVAGVAINYYYRVYILIPTQEAMQFTPIVRGGWQLTSYILLVVHGTNVAILKLFKHWFKKQQEWMQAEKEKVTAELQLLKAQIHPHFLFNTLNNIYSFSLENSSKTPELILKLSALLSYMLYDCSKDAVSLGKEIEIMKSYIDLEKERYGNNIDISWMVSGAIDGKHIAPLLMLPFLENAFKHGTSEQVEKPWLSVEIAANDNEVKCKMINSKNPGSFGKNGGIGLQNAMKRLKIMYPDKHELKINDEGNFFVVSLMVHLN